MEILRLPASVMLTPVDGSSLKPLLTAELKTRAKPLPFRHTGRAAFVDNRFKLVTQSVSAGKFELYDLETDPRETTDLSAAQPAVAGRLREAFLAWNEAVKASVAGRDYPEGKVSATEPKSRDWTTSPEYAPYLAELSKRPEFKNAAKER